jgi:hypothetical protein
MERSDHLHDVAGSSLVQQAPVSAVKETDWVQMLVYMRWWRENSLPHSRIQTLTIQPVANCFFEWVFQTEIVP